MTEPHREADAQAASPAAVTDEDTAWFANPTWQAGEAEVDEHLRAGRVRTFATVDDLLADLHGSATE